MPSSSARVCHLRVVVAFIFNRWPQNCFQFEIFVRKRLFQFSSQALRLECCFPVSKHIEKCHFCGYISIPAVVPLNFHLFFYTRVYHSLSQSNRTERILMIEKRAWTITSSGGDSLCCVGGGCGWKLTVLSMVSRDEDNSVQTTPVSNRQIYSKVFGRKATPSVRTANAYQYWLSPALLEMVI